MTNQSKDKRSKPQPQPQANPKQPSPAAVALAQKLANLQDDALKDALAKLAVENPKLMAEIIKIWLSE